MWQHKSQHSSVQAQGCGRVSKDGTRAAACRRQLPGAAAHATADAPALARPPRLVQGLRPWISAPCSLLLCAIADRLGIHRPLLLACFLISASLRGSLALVTPHFATVAVLILTADAVAAPVAVIADSSVVAKCVKDGEYGKQR